MTRFECARIAAAICHIGWTPVRHRSTRVLFALGLHARYAHGNKVVLKRWRLLSTDLQENQPCCTEQDV